MEEREGPRGAGLGPWPLLVTQDPAAKLASGTDSGRTGSPFALRWRKGAWIPAPTPPLTSTSPRWPQSPPLYNGRWAWVPLRSLLSPDARSQLPRSFAHTFLHFLRQRIRVGDLLSPLAPPGCGLRSCKLCWRPVTHSGDTAVKGQGF